MGSEMCIRDSSQPTPMDNHPWQIDDGGNSIIFCRIGGPPVDMVRADHIRGCILAIFPETTDHWPGKEVAWTPGREGRKVDLGAAQALVQGLT